ncbi:type II toxin-antitoxin system VapC family toxin [Scytonema sp. PCC 10023]|uniref:type II toxin-antitoxin system VapC family toxin n=1 Tax=Scytonema sp. PCC 10023 TaxID=1680591 RepID=UPI0039C71FA5
MTVVLDASALLAYLQDEPGSEAVEVVLAESVISSVNWAEVVQKSVAAGVVIDGMREDLEALGLMIAPFTPEDAQMAGRLWLQTRQAGLSLGDRACLSLGMRLDVSVLTTDQIWATLGLSLDVRMVR